ncbi:MAG: T9SS type A sorting domain-containing protein [Bacteroidetes bacterium]|nr:T9SS type A sorting domain-containing protein [Bacteroidota bacterium]
MLSKLSDRNFENSPWYKTSLFPNPSTGSVFIQSDYEVWSYKIESLVGQLIKQENANAKTFLVDISNYVDGVYLVTITTDKGTMLKKLIKKGL